MRTRNRKSERGSNTRRQILASATRLYTGGGYKAVTIAAVCTEVGCTPTSVYWHYTNKAELLYAVLSDLNSASNKSFVAALSGRAKPETKARRFVAALREYVVNHPAGAMTMLTLIREGEPSRELKEIIARNRAEELEEQTAGLADFLGIESIDARMLALKINSTANYAALIHSMGASEEEIGDLLKVLEHDIVQIARP